MSWLAKILGQQDINSLPELDPERVISFQKQEESLAIQYSGAMGLWHEAQANSEPLYEEENVNSLSVEGHARAEEFRKFMGITQTKLYLILGAAHNHSPVIWPMQIYRKCMALTQSVDHIEHIITMKVLLNLFRGIPGHLIESL